MALSLFMIYYIYYIDKKKYIYKLLLTFYKWLKLSRWVDFDPAKLKIIYKTIFNII